MFVAEKYIMWDTYSGLQAGLGKTRPSKERKRGNVPVSGSDELQETTAAMVGVDVYTDIMRA